MRLPRVRFTARLMMVIIAVVAIILAVTHQVQEGRRQRALVVRLQQVIELNKVVQLRLRLMSEDARRRDALEEKVYRSLGEEMRQEEQALRQILCQLRP